MGILHHTASEVRSSGSQAWSHLEKVGFRFAFIFFILLIVPIEGEWYKRLFESESVYDFLSTVAGGSRLGIVRIETESGRWGLASYGSWGLAAVVGVLGAAIWTILSRNSKRQQYNVLYYWLRVLVRYRIAIGLIAFGFIKFYPMQMPFPSISNLNTDIGDYAPFKLYWQIVGVSWKYEIFLGFLEIAAGSLMLFRATTVLGAIINAGVLFNIAHANLGYDGGVHVYSSYFVLLSLFLLIQYIPNIWRLFINGEAVKPAYYYPNFSSKKLKPLRIGLKAIFIFFFLFVYGYNRYDRFYNGGRLKEPVIPGLAGATGHYNVTSFTLNGDTLNYSPHDSVRWHDVALERYSTLVFKVNKPKEIALGNGGPGVSDLLKDYEFTGRAGGKTYLYYEIDTVENKLYLVDKNQKFSKDITKRFDKENSINLKALYKTPIRDSINILQWNYNRPGKNKIVLSGRDEYKNSISVELEKLDETYLAGKEWYMENHVYTYK